MKIDLLKDKGLLDPQEFQERVAPDLRTDAHIERVDTESKPVKTSTRKPEQPPLPPIDDQPRESVRGLFLVLGTLAVIIVLGFLYKQGKLDTIIAALKPVPTVVDTTFSSDTTGGQETDMPFLLDSIEIARIEDSLAQVLADSILPQDVFEQLLPAPSAISITEEDSQLTSRPEIIADSGMAVTQIDETLEQDQTIMAGESDASEDTVTALMTDTDTLIAEIGAIEPEKQYTFRDSQIVTNQTMFQLAAKLVSVLNRSEKSSQLYLDRQQVKLEMDQGKLDLRETVQSTIRPVADGALKESVQTGKLIISGKFQYIFEISPAFEPEAGDIHFVLDKLVEPFDQYITHIITKLDGGIDGNPVQIRITGNHWVTRVILEHWGQLSVNFILNDLSIQKSETGFESIVNLTLFRYE
ncbi:MAG: hypothetical protein K9N11_04710 [Lentisphaeria bacterium]|nr:hypothetical protein [Candidatus Neomarinimicrobiota bacterium]MCF7842136.1 hypothetical protein [Lentisphaeria bacterium]